MSRKLSRSGKKKKSQYRKTVKEQEQMVKEATPEERGMEKKRLRFNGVALGLLTVALILMLGAPTFDRMGFLPYQASTILAYVCSLVAGALMLYSLKYTREEKKTTGRITGGLMVGVGLIGLITTLSPLLTG